MLHCRNCTATSAFLQCGSHLDQKLRCSKRKLHCNIEQAALQESGAFLPLSCGFQAPTFRHPRLGPAEDIELILARILPRISEVPQFRLVLMSATLNVDSFNRRLLNASIAAKDIGIFLMEERTNPLSLHCLPQDLLRDRDSMELALRMVIKLHHEYPHGYQDSPRSRTGPILVFVPGKAEIRLLTDLIKNALKRNYTKGLWPYGFHADTSERDRAFLTTGDDDPDSSRYGELVNYNKGKKFESEHPCNASMDAKAKRRFPRLFLTDGRSCRQTLQKRR